VAYPICFFSFGFTQEIASIEFEKDEKLTELSPSRSRNLMASKENSEQINHHCNQEYQREKKKSYNKPEVFRSLPLSQPSGNNLKKKNEHKEV